MELITINAAARELGVNARTLARHVESGRIPSIVVNGAGTRREMRVLIREYLPMLARQYGAENALREAEQNG